jgi:hypothetical protein
LSSAPGGALSQDGVAPCVGAIFGGVAATSLGVQGTGDPLGFLDGLLGSGALPDQLLGVGRGVGPCPLVLLRLLGLRDPAEFVDFPERVAGAIGGAGGVGSLLSVLRFAEFRFLLVEERPLYGGVPLELALGAGLPVLLTELAHAGATGLDPLIHRVADGLEVGKEALGMTLGLGLSELLAALLHLGHELVDEAGNRGWIVLKCDEYRQDEGVVVHAGILVGRGIYGLSGHSGTEFLKVCHRVSRRRGQHRVALGVRSGDQRGHGDAVCLVNVAALGRVVGTEPDLRSLVRVDHHHEGEGIAYVHALQAAGVACGECSSVDVEPLVTQAQPCAQEGVVGMSG